MFRDLYTKANEDIKGDRAILDRAFLQAAQPVKKKNPVFKYSVVGTAVAAVIVMGAVFVNSDIFMNKTEYLPITETTPTESVVTGEDVVKAKSTTEDYILYDMANENSLQNIEDGKAQKEYTYAERMQNVNENVPAVNENEGNNDFSVASGEDNQFEVYTGEEDIAVMSLEDEDDEYIPEAATEEPVLFSTGRQHPEASDEAVNEKPTQALKNTAYDEEAWEDDDGAPESSVSTTTSNAGGGTGSVAGAEIEVEIFSYLYDKELYKHVVQGEYKNTDEVPIENAEAAIERAKAECTVEYDTVNAYYDPIEKVWMVSFYRKGWLGGNQDIYMNANGVTQFIVYGE